MNFNKLCNYKKHKKHKNFEKKYKMLKAKKMKYKTLSYFSRGIYI